MKTKSEVEALLREAEEMSEAITEDIKKIVEEREDMKRKMEVADMSTRQHYVERDKALVRTQGMLEAYKNVLSENTTDTKTDKETKDTV